MPDTPRGSDPSLDPVSAVGLFLPCDLCGSGSGVAVRQPPNLDGPLVQCPECGLYYVGVRASGLAYGTAPGVSTARKIAEANRRFPDLPREEEERLDLLNARWRLDLIKRYRRSGRLLEVGCGRGAFLKAAREVFEVCGVEPNPEHAREASREAEVFEGLVEDSPWSGFDVAVSFHVLEHVASPSRFLQSLADRLNRGGLLAIETPDIGAWPYRVFGSRWRQFIPEHYYFFDHETLTRMLSKSGFDLRHLSSAGKYASPALLLNRLSRQVSFLQSLSRRTSTWAFPVNPGDIMLAIAVRR